MAGYSSKDSGIRQVVQVMYGQPFSGRAGGVVSRGGCSGDMLRHRRGSRCS